MPDPSLPPFPSPAGRDANDAEIEGWLSDTQKALAPLTTPPDVAAALSSFRSLIARDYPNEYVAYSMTDSGPVVRAHDASLQVVHAALEGLSEDDMNRVEVTHTGSSEGGFRVGMRLRLVPSNSE